MTEKPKDNWYERYRADSELQFFGTITASVSHELNNVVSIVNQTGGLLEDILYGARQGEEITTESLERIASKIAAQTERGISIIKRLNSFAHTVDDPVMQFNLTESIGNLMQLCERFAALRGVELAGDDIRNDISITNNQINVQRLVFLAMRDILGTGQKGDSVSYSILEADTGVVVTLCQHAGRISDLANSEDIDALSGKIGAKIETGFEDGCFKVKIILPKRIDGN